MFAGFFDETYPRVTRVVTILVFNITLFVCFFLIDVPEAVALFNVVAFSTGFSAGVLQCNLYKAATGFDDKNQGFLVSFIFSGASFGSCVMNPILTWFVNPNNLAPDTTVGILKLFTSPEIAGRVPSMFLVFGAASSFLQLVGVCLVRDNKTDPERAEHGIYGSTSGPPLHLPSTNDINRDRTIETQSKWVSIVKLFRQPAFLILWLAFAFSNFTKVLINNYYKEFALHWIHDDHFLTDTGVVMGVACGLSRVVWGFALDKYSIKASLVVVFSLSSVLSVVVYFMAMVNKWLYLVTVVLLTCVRHTSFSSIAAANAVYFGMADRGKNLGYLMSGSVLANLMAPEIFRLLLETQGWFSLFLFSAVVNLTTLILIVVCLAFKK